MPLHGILSMYKDFGCVEVFEVCLWLNEIPDGYTWQADVGLRGPAEVDGVPVQTDVLQCVPDVIEILQVAERVLMHGLNIVALQGITKVDNIKNGIIMRKRCIFCCVITLFLLYCLLIMFTGVYHSDRRQENSHNKKKVNSHAQM